MDYYQLIAGKFQTSLEAITFLVDSIAAPLEDASALLTDTLLSERKVICCGSGSDGLTAQLVVNKLLNQGDRERPALPAITLTADASTLSAIAASQGDSEIYSRQIRALGQAGDALLCISSTPATESLLRAVESARERQVQVVVLCRGDDSSLSSTLSQSDIAITFDGSSSVIAELQLMTIHTLCELIDHRIFGSY